MAIPTHSKDGYPIVEFILRRWKREEGKVAYIVPLIPCETGNILPYRVAVRVTKIFSWYHFRSDTTIYLHYVGKDNPLESFKPSYDYSTITFDDPILLDAIHLLKQLDEIAHRKLNPTTSTIHNKLNTYLHSPTTDPRIVSFLKEYYDQ